MHANYKYDVPYNIEDGEFFPIFKMKDYNQMSKTEFSKLYFKTFKKCFEWKDVPKKAHRCMMQGLSFLIISILFVSLGQYMSL